MKFGSNGRKPTGRFLRGAGASGAAIVAALAATSPAFAQESADGGGEIVVTGTRLRTDGMRAPTPVSVISSEEIEAAAPKEISDFVNQIPSITGSMTLRSRAAQASNGTGGISMPSLRGVGTNRTLVLLDGQRSVPVTQTGETDVLSFPQQLIERVEVVTGGASAVYGSDALAGVVNFILDTDFDGFKVEASTGVTEIGDNFNWKVAMTAGTDFAGDRGHFMVSYEHQDNDGVGRDYGALARGEPPERDWLYGAPMYVRNPAYTPTNGQPQYISRGQASAALATPGGIITSGPLAGTAFTNSGEPYRFQYGPYFDSAPAAPNTTGTFMAGGGDWRNADVMVMPTLDPTYERDNFFARADFDLTSNINVFAQVQLSDSAVRSNHSLRAELGTLTLRADNAYLPESIRTQLAALGQTSFRFGTFMEGDALGSYIERTFQRYSIGGSGDFDIFGDTWNWDFYAQAGRAKGNEFVTGNQRLANFNRAIDAVVDPATGAIVCRSTLNNPTDGCRPLNLIGWDNFVDPAAYDYSFGRGNRIQHFDQDIYSLSFSGEPFSLWTEDPVALAFGIEHRKEETRGTVDPRTAANEYRTNFLPINGEFDVTEGYVEVGVPLLRDTAFAEALDFNGAVRATHYSISGDVTTWKAGLTWEPIYGLRIRGTRSRDIRAPSMSEFFTRGLFITFAARDPWAGNVTRPNAIQFVTGNLDLVPEEADTTGIGVVFQPSFARGLSLSVDYYKIEISDAIGTVNSQTIIDQCFAGNSVFCGGVLRQDTDGDGQLEVTRISQQPFNFASESHSGIDFEVRYEMPAERIFESLSGDLNFRLFATHFLEAESDNGISAPVDLLGEYQVRAETPSIASIPEWKYQASITYSSDLWAATLSAHGVSEGVWENLQVGCRTDCPAASSLPVGAITVDDNTAPSTFYVDGTVTLKPELPGNPELWFNVQNLFNEEPGIQPRGPGGLAYGTMPTNVQIYDVLGRTYQMGLRMRF